MGARVESRNYAIPEHMSVAAARFFAADWEASSFLEFFVDLRLRVEEDRGSGLGRSTERLTDHSRFALQLTLLRAVDSFLGYLAEIEAASSSKPSTLDGAAWHHLSWGRGIPVDVSEHYSGPLVHGNVRQVDRLFERATGIRVFETAEDIDRVTRMVMLRNLIAHGRTFASDELASLVDETVSVGGLGLKLNIVREDLGLLFASVVHVDAVAAAKNLLLQPVSRSDFLAAISDAAKLGPAKESLSGEIGSDDLGRFR